MAYELNDGQGNLYANKKKKTERSPDILGKVMLNGQLYGIAGWKKTGDHGSWYSLSVSEWEDRSGSQSGKIDF